jgi:hypothetical protein
MFAEISRCRHDGEEKPAETASPILAPLRHCPPMLSLSALTFLGRNEGGSAVQYPYTLNLNSITSPSFTTYSLPSIR